jgi:hypothetical protein
MPCRRNPAIIKKRNTYTCGIPQIDPIYKKPVKNEVPSDVRTGICVCRCINGAYITSILRLIQCKAIFYATPLPLQILETPNAWLFHSGSLRGMLAVPKSHIASILIYSGNSPLFLSGYRCHMKLVPLGNRRNPNREATACNFTSIDLQWIYHGLPSACFLSTADTSNDSMRSSPT